MKLVLMHTGRVIAADITELRTLQERTLGLLRDTEPRAVYFKTRLGIHTIGMRFPIDVIVCDTHFRVKKSKERMTPNHFFFWNPRWANVFELPPGTIRESGVSLGDALVIDNKKVAVSGDF